MKDITFWRGEKILGGWGGERGKELLSQPEQVNNFSVRDTVRGKRKFL